MISHDHRCIFTHVPKTAGKSVRWLFGLPEFQHQFRPDGRNIENAYGHQRLAEFVNQIYFPEYFKFAFVRNPFDRLVSAFFYLHHGGCNEHDKSFRDRYLLPYRGNFAGFVEDLDRLIDAPHFQPQAVWLCGSNGELLADFVGRYENFACGLKAIGSRLGLSLDGPAPVLNASSHEPYRTYYDDATRRRVAAAYGEDVELFAYRFD